MRCKCWCALPRRPIYSIGPRECIVKRMQITGLAPFAGQVRTNSRKGKAASQRTNDRWSAVLGCSRGAMLSAPAKTQGPEGDNYGFRVARCSAASEASGPCLGPAIDHWPYNRWSTRSWRMGREGRMGAQLCLENNFPPSKQNTRLGTRGACSVRNVPRCQNRYGRYAPGSNWQATPSTRRSSTLPSTANCVAVIW